MRRSADQACAVLTARAKLNLTLEIHDLEDDGFHRLHSLMQKLSLADRLFVRRTDKGADELRCLDPTVPSGPDNIVLRAIDAYREQTGLDAFFSIVLEKQIPHGAGLGGGSSDAAAILRFLNDPSEHHGHERLADDRLLALAASIGADVPFCLFGRTAFAAGIGERLTPWRPLPPYAVLLLSPPERIGTKAAFGRLDERRAGGRRDDPDFDHEAVHRRLLLGRRSFSLLPNSFLPVAREALPDLPLADFLEDDEQIVARGMSGSGPTVFLLFPDEPSRDAAAARAAAHYPGVRQLSCRLDDNV